MTYREYVQKLHSILKNIDEGNIALADSELHQIERVYPRSLGYYVCAVKKNLKTLAEKYSPYEKMGGKIYYTKDYLFVSETMKLFREAAGNKWIDDYYKKLLMILRDDESVYDSVDIACENTDDEAGCLLACKELYCVLDTYAYVIHRCASNMKYPKLKQWFSPKHIYNRCNIQVFLKDLDNHSPMILIETENYSAIPQMLLQDLQYLNVPVCYVRLPAAVDESELDNVWDITVSSIEKKEDVTYITPVAVNFADGYTANNVDDVLQYIKEEVFCSDLVGVLGEMQYLEYLSVTPSLQKNFYKITTGMMSRSYRCLNYALYGDYLSYISKIYDENIKELIHQPTEKKFTIIIPARNSADTLRYTLQTCLEQTYQGDYEIIVSDNSTGQNAAVYELCKELNDDRIVYLKTPRDLHLPKSFEFAYTHAKGEYVFSIGSDDGLVPWALEELNKIIERYPEEEIIQWERGFYAWPGFNGGQQNQMIIPRAYQREDYRIYYKDGRDYIAEVMMEPRKKYSLPMLYINSCYRKSYLNTLLEKTGRLWDGVCQDIYMGIVTAAINPRILNVEFPLTIAGMSDASVGANANRGVHTNAEFEKLMQRVQKDNNVGGYYRTLYEQYIPSTGTDTYSLYTSIMRAISIGIIPEVYIDQVIPWKLWYQNLAMELDIMDVAFDAKIHEMRYCASLLGEDFLTWFDEAIYEPLLKPVYIDEKPACEKDEKPLRTYQVGRKENGELTVDASEYGVSNVYEATELFVKLMQE